MGRSMRPTRKPSPRLMELNDMRLFATVAIIEVGGFRVIRGTARQFLVPSAQTMVVRATVVPNDARELPRDEQVASYGSRFYTDAQRMVEAINSKP